MQTEGYRDTKWHRRPLRCSDTLRAWLTDRGSLTQRLKERCQNVKIEVVRLSLSQVFTDELKAIGCAPKKLAMVREVYLYCGDIPVVFAHTIYQARSGRHAWQSIAGLGNRSLGAALFSNPKVKRQMLHYKKLNPSDKLFQRAAKRLGTTPSHLSARRSLFILQGEPLLVTEVFLPSLEEIKS